LTTVSISLSVIGVFKNDTKVPGVLHPAKHSATFLSLVQEDNKEGFDE